MGLGEFNKEDSEPLMSEINTTPLVDVMLVLLVIFLVTAPMMTQAVKLELPNETATEIVDENPIVISISAEGEYFWDKEALSDQQIEQRLQFAATQESQRPIHLRADTRVPHGKVSKVLALAQKYGMNNIGFVMEPK